MKKYFFPLLYVIISFICINSCSDRSDVWILEWRFINIADSVAGIKTPQHEITVQSKYQADVSWDSLKSDGSFIAQIGIDGDQKVIDEFPSTAMLHVKLSYDTLIAFDSTFTFDELDFKRGYSVIYNTEQLHVSKKTFYIKVP
jgi:hypothetical protein